MTLSARGDGELRSIVLHGREVPYLFRRSARRSLGITIDQHGVTLAVPLRTSLREAENMLHERAAWVLEKLDDWAKRAPPAPLAIADGVVFQMLGQPCSLHLLAGPGRPLIVESMGSRELRLPLRPGVDPLPHLLRTLQRQALSYFTGRLDEYMYVMRLDAPDLPTPVLRLTNARTRWGSCSRRSGIRLNWRLIHLPQALIDYVVAHEVAHLLEMNHSVRFWAVVESLYPDYAEARAALRHAHSFIPSWS